MCMHTAKGVTGTKLCLCRVYAHGKGCHLGPNGVCAVRMHTAKAANLGPNGAFAVHSSEESARQITSHGIAVAHGKEVDTVKRRAHGKATPRQSLCRATRTAKKKSRQNKAHGNARRTAKFKGGSRVQDTRQSYSGTTVTAPSRPRRRQVTFVCRAVQFCTRQRLCRAIFAVHTAKPILPSQTLPWCSLPCVWHGKGFAVLFFGFAVLHMEHGKDCDSCSECFQVQIN